MFGGANPVRYSFAMRPAHAFGWLFPWRVYNMRFVSADAAAYAMAVSLAIAYDNGFPRVARIVTLPPR